MQDLTPIRLRLEEIQQGLPLAALATLLTYDLPAVLAENEGQRQALENMRAVLAHLDARHIFHLREIDRLRALLRAEGIDPGPPPPEPPARP